MLSWLEAEVDLLLYFFLEPTTLVFDLVGSSLRLSSPLAASFQKKVNQYDGTCFRPSVTTVACSKTQNRNVLVSAVLSDVWQTSWSIFSLDVEVFCVWMLSRITFEEFQRLKMVFPMENSQAYLTDGRGLEGVNPPAKLLSLTSLLFKRLAYLPLKPTHEEKHEDRKNRRDKRECSAVCGFHLWKNWLFLTLPCKKIALLINPLQTHHQSSPLRLDSVVKRLPTSSYELKCS